jgi:hypothetical protein
MKIVFTVLAALALAGCGIADTTTAAAVAAKTKAAEIERAKELQQKVVGDIEKAQAQADQRLREAESK